MCIRDRLLNKQYQRHMWDCLLYTSINLQVALYQLGQSNSQISTAMSLLALLFGAVLLVALDLISDAMRKSREGK